MSLGRPATSAARPVTQQVATTAALPALQQVQREVRTYQVERRIFQVLHRASKEHLAPPTLNCKLQTPDPCHLAQELLEVKKLQIRAGRANEAVMVKRLAERQARAQDRCGGCWWSWWIQAVVPRLAGAGTYQGEFTFHGLEQHLYTELRRAQDQGHQQVKDQTTHIALHCTALSRTR